MHPRSKRTILTTASLSSATLALMLSGIAPASAIEYPGPLPAPAASSAPAPTLASAAATSNYPTLETGVQLPPGYLAGTVVTVEQNVHRQTWIDQLKQLRSDMWDENPVFNTDGAAGTQTLQEFLAKRGITTKAQYLDNVRWDANLEKLALQRVAEIQVFYTHQRPTGHGLDSTGYNFFENIALDFRVDELIQAWGYDELPALKQSGGAFGPANGHLHNMLNPNADGFAMAFLPGTNGTLDAGVWVAPLRYSGNSVGENLDGTYLSKFTLPESLVAKYTISTAASQINVGQTTDVVINPATDPAYPGLGQTQLRGTWSSSNDAIATVDADGRVTGVSGGTATITFTSDQQAAMVAAAPESFSVDITVVGAAAEPTPAPADPTPTETAPAPAPADPAPTAPAPSEPAPVPADPAPTAPAPSEPAPSDSAPAPAQPSQLSPVLPAPATPAPADAAPAPAQPSAPAPNNSADADFEYKNCAAVWAAVGGPIHVGDYGYGPGLDADRDGTACELAPGYENTRNGGSGQGFHLADSAYTGGGYYAGESYYAGDSQAYSDPQFYPANGSADESYYDTLANTGFGAVLAFSGGLFLLAVGTAAVLGARRSGRSTR